VNGLEERNDLQGTVLALPTWIENEPWNLQSTGGRDPTIPAFDGTIATDTGLLNGGSARGRGQACGWRIRKGSSLRHASVFRIQSSPNLKISGF